MSEEREDRFVAEGLGLLSINEPGDFTSSNSVPRDVHLIGRVALSSLGGREKRELNLWIEDEARHLGAWRCQYLPPLSILKCTDLLNELWGWDMLLAYDHRVEFEDPSDMTLYESYLEKYYACNRHHKSGADAILQCLEKEKALTSEWKAKRGKVFRINVELSEDIQEFMSDLVNDAGSESRRPFSTYAADCITKEAELMIGWLNQESSVPFEVYNTSNEIRQVALNLAMLEGNWNTHTAAVLLGITKEAGFLLNTTEISRRIRTHGLRFLMDKLDELESTAQLTPGISDEMTSATELNQFTWGNTESVSFGKNEMQEQCVSKKIVDPENNRERYSLTICHGLRVVFEGFVDEEEKLRQTLKREGVTKTAG